MIPQACSLSNYRKLGNITCVIYSWPVARVGCGLGSASLLNNDLKSIDCWTGKLLLNLTLPLSGAAQTCSYWMKYSMSCAGTIISKIMEKHTEEKNVPKYLWIMIKQQ